MERMRKSYLLYRWDAETEKESVKGVFSSMKKARSGVRQDAQSLDQESPGDGKPVLEQTGDGYRLSLPDGRRMTYRIEQRTEDHVL